MADKRQPPKSADKDEYIILRLRQVLLRHSKEFTWLHLEEAIRDANGGGDNATIDRRTLPHLCDDINFSKVRLSLAQLVALDKYFVASGEGPLFARERSLVDAVAESPSVAFYVGAKYHSKLYTHTVSAFDLEAITTLLTTRLGRLDIRINDIYSFKEWKKAWAANATIANVAVGSPIASDASDGMLRDMLGFSVTKNTNIKKLPFFIVRRDIEKGLSSGFLRTKLNAVSRDATAANGITNEVRALVIENNVFVSSDQVDYGLLVAQRDPASGQIRTVLCGLTGRSTRQLSIIMRAGGPMVELPELQAKETRPPILAVVYEFAVEGRKAKTRNAPEKRKITGNTPVYGPVFLNHSDRGWCSPVEVPKAR